MNKTVAALLGAASFVPLAFAIVEVPGWLIAGRLARLSPPAIVFWGVMLTAFAATTCYFIVKVLTSRTFTPMQQLLWFMALYSVAPIAAPAYWWQYLRPLSRS